MENASKALIIAGAILIALLLISVGIMLFTGSSGLFNSARSKMSDQEKSMFNSTYTAYEGSNIPGSSVKELVRTVMINNTDTDNNPHIQINGNDPTNETVNGFNNVRRYTVTLQYGNDGIVNNITIVAPNT